MSVANTVDTTKPVSETRQMHGRRVIKSSVTEITKANVVDVLQKALNVHYLNSSEIDYLWEYYKGNQPILNRVKEVRPEICNKIVENRANEIVAFKVGYLCGEPIQYVGRNGKEETTNAITLLNELMFAEDKSSKDQQIVEWQMICGTAFRLVLPNSEEGEDEAPFEIFTLDPRETFVVYSNQIGNKPLMAVKYCKDSDTQITTYSVYTKNQYFLIEDTIVKEVKPHALGMIPIFEYPANNARMGAFEVVLPLLDTINLIASNSMDGMEQLIQAFIKFINCDISKEEYEEFLELGAIKVKSVDGQKADVGVVTTELNQSQSQTFKDDCYNAVLTICGMPNRNGGTSTSDTGAAVLLRDGWSLAEARAKDSEHMFKSSEKQMLKLVLRICDTFSDLKLKLREIDLKFTRRNYENIQSK
jgi:SPP1 family phage portal protein